jgi:hypothetical protein
MFLYKILSPRKVKKDNSRTNFCMCYVFVSLYVTISRVIIMDAPHICIGMLSEMSRNAVSRDVTDKITRHESSTHEQVH